MITPSHGAPKKTVDCSIAHSYGWKAKISLNDGLEKVIKDYIKKL
jgi:nucleoside-diphosphate-sugar epimerase